MKKQYSESADKDKREELTSTYKKYKKIFIGYAKKNGYPIENYILEELYYESFSVLWENMHKGKYKRTSASAGTYLMSIGKNKLLNYLKKKKIDINEITNTDVNYESNHWNLVQDAVYEVIKNMEEPCNTILSLVYWKRENFTEIAKIFQYSTKFVARNKKWSCMKKVKELLMKELEKKDITI